MRIPSRSDRLPIRASLRLAALLAVVCLASPATAGTAGTAATGSSATPSATGSDRVAQAGHSGLWWRVGVLTGSAKPDDHLADYQWDTSPQLAYGTRAMLGHGRLAAGLGMWRSNTTQSTGFSSTEDLTVSTTTWEALGEGRLFTAWGVDVTAIASLGRMHLGYDPGQMTIDPGTGTPVVVEFKPVDEWIGGGGFGVRHAIGSHGSLGLSMEHRWYGLDTAHRSGSVIVQQRETFGEWSARLEMAWVHTPR